MLTSKQIRFIGIQRDCLKERSLFFIAVFMMQRLLLRAFALKNNSNHIGFSVFNTIFTGRTGMGVSLVAPPSL
jgi:hypothetical protein